MFKSSSLSNTHAKSGNQIDDLRFTSRVTARDGYTPQETLTTGRHKTLVEAFKYLIDYARKNKLHPIYCFYYIEDMKTGQKFEFRMSADDAYNQFQLQKSVPGIEYSAEFEAAFNAAQVQEKAASSALSSSSYAYQVFSNLLSYGSTGAAPSLSPAKPAAKVSSSHFAAAAAASSPANAIPYVQWLEGTQPYTPHHNVGRRRCTNEEAFEYCIYLINSGRWFSKQLLKVTIDAYPGVLGLKSTEEHGSPLIISTLYKIRIMADALPSVNQNMVAFRQTIEDLLEVALYIVRNSMFDYRATDVSGNTPMHRVFWYAIHVEDQAISDRLIEIGLEMLRKIRSAEFRAVLNQKNRSNESCRNNIDLSDAYLSRLTPNQQINYTRLHAALRSNLLVEQSGENKSYNFTEKSFAEHYEDAISDNLISFELMQSPLVDQETGITLNKTTWEDLRDREQNHPITGVSFTEESYKKLLPNQPIKALNDLYNQYADDVDRLFEEASNYVSAHPLTAIEEKFDLDPQLKSLYQLIQQYAEHKANLVAASVPVVLASSVAAAAAQADQQSALSYSANQVSGVMFSSSLAQEKPASALSTAAASATKSVFFAPSSALSTSTPVQYHITSTQADRLLAELVVRLSRNKIVSINTFVDRYVKNLPDHYQTVFMSYLRQAKERYQSQYGEGYPEKDHLVWLRLITQGDKLSNTLSLLLHAENFETTAVGFGEDVDYRVMLTQIQKEFLEEIIGERLVFLQAPKPY